MNCILCQSQQTAVFREVAARQLCEAWRNVLHIDITDELSAADTITQWLCSDCGLGWYAPVELAGSAELYEQLQQHAWYYPEGKWEHRVCLNELAGAHEVLEVGSGRGEFLALTRGVAGLRAEGLEINHRAAEQACARGLSVRVQDLHDAAHQTPERYDAVCSFQVLEHVPNPHGFLEACCALLKPGGKLIIGLPNAQSFLKHQFNLLDMPPHHMTRWTPQVLRALTRLLPLRLTHLRHEPLAPYHVEGYVGVYCRLVADRTHWRMRQPAVVRSLATLVRLTGLRRMLTGQSIYACYTRV